MRGVGSYCSGAQTWRSDCSQRLWSVQRGGGGVQCKTSSSLPDVVIGPYVGIFDIHQETDVLERKHSWDFTWRNPAAASRWPSETAVGRPLCVHVWGQACRTERTIKRYRTFDRNKLVLSSWRSAGSTGSHAARWLLLFRIKFTTRVLLTGCSFPDRSRKNQSCIKRSQRHQCRRFKSSTFTLMKNQLWKPIWDP